MKLIQKRGFKGTREFEILDDSVFVRIKSPLKQEKLTVGLSMLNPEPFVNGSELEFHGRFKSEPLFSLFLNKPNAEEFNAFVDTLKQRVLEDSGISSGVQAASQPEGLDRNVYDEAPEFEEFDQIKVRKKGQVVNVSEVENAIHMLETYVADEAVKPLLSALQQLKAEPQNESHQQKVVDAFNGLGITQGAVLTYAPYLSIFLSDDPFGNH